MRGGAKEKRSAEQYVRVRYVDIKKRLRRRHSRTPVARAAEWFLTPADRLFHRGHAWLKGEDDGW